MEKKRVLSGIRATGRLHLGNYLGAVKGMLELQDRNEYETFYMVADLHTITVPYDKEHLSEAVKDVVLDYLAAGLQPEKSVIFVQSHVPEHVELSYLLSTVVSVARLSHLPTYKEKVKQYPKNVDMSLLYYPVLMAADILAYKASVVPVGVDQEPHLEVAREIAQKMNKQYGTSFPLPYRFKTKGEYVPSLTGEGKMSKSIEGTYISLVDDFSTIREKLASVPTDIGRGKTIPKKGGVATLLKLVELFEGIKRRRQYEEQYLGNGIKYNEMKEELANNIYQHLKVFQERRERLKKNQKYVNDILKKGASIAREIAGKTVQEVKDAMGLLSV